MNLDDLAAAAVVRPIDRAHSTLDSTPSNV